MRVITHPVIVGDRFFINIKFESDSLVFLDLKHKQQKNKIISHNENYYRMQFIPIVFFFK